MGKTYTEEEVIQRVFDANKQRGKYLAFIVKELDRAGFKDFDGALRKAIFNFGKDKSAACGSFDAKGFMNCLINDDVIKGIVGYEEVGTSDENRAEFTFSRCPLEEGWKEIGLSEDERQPGLHTGPVGSQICREGMCLPLLHRKPSLRRRERPCLDDARARRHAGQGDGCRSRAKVDAEGAGPLRRLACACSAV